MAELERSATLDRRTTRVDDNAALIKTQKTAHNLQRDRLTAKSNEEALLTEEIRTYMKRRAEIEFRYCEEQTNLCLQFLSARKAAIKPPTGKAGEDTTKLLSKAWVSFLEEARTCARTHGMLSEKLREGFVTPMKPFIEDKRKQFTKHSDYLVTKVQADLQTTFSELLAAKQLYDHCAKETERAQQKYDDAMKAPTGTLSKVFFKVTREKLDLARKKLKSATRKQQEARNAYILKIEKANSHLAYYYSTALPQVMKNMDGLYFDNMRHYMSEFGDIQIQNFKDMITSMTVLVTAAGKINRDLDNRDFVQDNGPLFAQVRPFQLELYSSDKMDKIEVDEVSKVVLSQELAKLTAKHTTVSEQIAKKDKEIEAARRMTKIYDTTPSFGRASETLEEEEQLHMTRDLLMGEKHRLEAQTKRLIDAGVEIINPVSPGKKLRREPTSDKLKVPQGGPTSSSAKTCVAQYGYTAQNPDELNFAAGEVMLVIQDEGEWIKASLNGQEGYIPANYVNMKAATTKPGQAEAGAVQGRGSEEDSELSFHAGDIIEIIARGTDDDPNFWEGRLNGKTGYFPAMFVGELDGEDDMSSLRSETSTLNECVDDITPTNSAPTSNMLTVPAVNHKGMSRSGSAISVDSLTVPQPPSSSVVALYDYVAQVEGELSFRAGERIEVTNRDIGSEDWWEGLNEAGELGQFPHAYVTEEKPNAPSPAMGIRNATRGTRF